jgi:hypothetical protein
MRRRHFLALCTATASGLWLPGRGLIELTRKMVLAISGVCSFCGKRPDEVEGLAGALGRPARICSECVRQSAELMAEAAVDGFDENDLATLAALPDEQAIPALLAALSTAAPYSEGAINAARSILAGERGTELALGQRTSDNCTFCGKTPYEMERFFASPRAGICDVCVGDAAALFASVLPPGA